jgi:putative glutamine amidotransferase
MSRQQPRIVCNRDLTEGVWTLPDAFRVVLAEAGAETVEVGPDSGDPSDLLAEADGLVLTGGNDPDLEQFGGVAPPPECSVIDADKQAFDTALARTALEENLPVLGVCWGMQLLGLLAGAGLIQHLDEPRLAIHLDGWHDVRLEAGSTLRDACDLNRFEVLSRHHQALADGGSWRVTGRSDDGTVEGIEDPTGAFRVGVQWHPERTPSHPGTRRLFSAFVEAAEGVDA